MPEAAVPLPEERQTLRPSTAGPAKERSPVVPKMLRKMLRRGLPVRVHGHRPVDEGRHRLDSGQKVAHNRGRHILCPRYVLRRLLQLSVRHGRSRERLLAGRSRNTY